MCCESGKQNRLDLRDASLDLLLLSCASARGRPNTTEPLSFKRCERATFPTSCEWRSLREISTAASAPRNRASGGAPTPPATPQTRRETDRRTRRNTVRSSWGCRTRRGAGGPRMQARFDPVAVACSPATNRHCTTSAASDGSRALSQTSPRRVPVQGEGKAASFLEPSAFRLTHNLRQ